MGAESREANQVIDVDLLLIVYGNINKIIDDLWCDFDSHEVSIFSFYAFITWDGRNIIVNNNFNPSLFSLNPSSRDFLIENEYTTGWEYN